MASALEKSTSHSAKVTEKHPRLQSKNGIQLSLSRLNRTVCQTSSARTCNRSNCYITCSHNFFVLGKISYVLTLNKKGDQSRRCVSF